MFRKWILFMIVSAVLLFVSGCLMRIDPITGERTYQIDPNAIPAYEETAEAAIGILAILSTIWPVLLPAVGIAAGVYGTWKKVKPQLATAQSEAAMYHTATKSVVTAIENFKINNPKEWLILEERLKKAIGPNAENVIRALRGLPPKE